MTLVTLLDLENSLKINHLLLKSQNNANTSNDQLHMQQQQHQSNLNFMLQNASVTKANLFTSAMMQQLQQQNKSLILNCLQSSSNCNSIITANSSQQSKASSECGSVSQHGQKQSQINSGRYKTELCRQYIENGGCKYGDKCQFAHGSPDLKDMNRHPKYKTDYCRTFHSKGFCPYGPRCHFIHELNEKFEGCMVMPSGKKQNKSGMSMDKPSYVESHLDSLESLQARLSTNLFVTEDSRETLERQSAYNLSMAKNLNQNDELNSSFLSSSSPPISPMPQPGTRSGTSSTSSLVSSSSSYHDLSQTSERVFSPAPPRLPLIRHQHQQQHHQTSSAFKVPITNNLIQIGRSLIQEKLSNPNQDQATLNQHILNIERLNHLLNINQINFYQTTGQQQGTW